MLCEFSYVKFILLIVIVLYTIVTVSAKAREITVTGPRGVLHRSFKHLAVDIQLCEIDGGKKLKVDLWFGNRETIAAVRLVFGLHAFTCIGWSSRYELCTFHPSHSFFVI